MVNAYMNLVRVVRVEGADCVPMDFHINSACRHRCPPEALGELMAWHPMLFPGAHFVAALGEMAIMARDDSCSMKREAKYEMQEYYA